MGMRRLVAKIQLIKHGIYYQWTELNHTSNKKKSVKMFHEQDIYVYFSELEKGKNGRNYTFPVTCIDTYGTLK